MTPTPIIGSPSSAEVTTPVTFTRVWACAETLPRARTAMTEIKYNLKFFIYFGYSFIKSVQRYGYFPVKQIIITSYNITRNINI